MGQKQLFNRIRELRVKKGFTRQELGQAAGVTRQSISLIESGDVSPSTLVALRLARVLGCQIEDLFWEVRETDTIEAKIVLDKGFHSDSPMRSYLANIGEEIIARPAYIGDVNSVHTPAHGVTRVRRQEDNRAKVQLLQSSASISKTAFISGCDTALGLLANYAAKMTSGCQGIWFNVPNRSALQELKDGVTHVAAVHYSEVNKKKILRDIPASYQFYHFANAQLGWILPRGNPRGFHDASDLAAGRLRIVNRPLGAGARELLDYELERFEVNAMRIPGYDMTLNGHMAVAGAVHDGMADIGLGHSSAAALYGLTFIPIQTEICSLVIPDSLQGTDAVQAVLETLQSDVFSKELNAYGPYDVSNIGGVD